MEISLLLQLLDEELPHEAKSLRGVERKVELLKDSLDRTLAFVKDNKHDESSRFRCMRKPEVRKVVRDAEDVVEMFLVNEGRGSFITKRGKTGEEIDSIQARLDAIHEKYNTPQRRSREREKPEEKEWRRFHNRETDVQVVGREDVVIKVLREILDEEKKGLSIAVVEGMVGIGKTTLARQIYNHPEVVARFECRAWATVSSKSRRAGMIMKQLILQLPGSDGQKIWEVESEESTKGERQAERYLEYMFGEMLDRQLQGKTYFIVIDREGDEDGRFDDSLYLFPESHFPNEKDQTSRLLLTTHIASGLPSSHEMRLLDPEKSWELFLMKTLIKGDYGRCPENLETIGRNIVKKCAGLPLTISLVGGLLAGTRTEREWKQVKMPIINPHDIGGGPESSFYRVVELSYKNLSPRLKSCFLCLALFKEVATIPAKTLIHIWVGQGLIQQDGTRTTEEIARGYLDELITRNMLQIVDLSMDDRVKNCHLHGVLRQLCLERAEEEFVLERVHNEKERHRAVYGVYLDSLSSFPGTYLRSLFLHNNDDVSSVSSCQLLKILHLDGVSLSTFPDSLCALVRLKYLMIRRRKIHSKCGLEVEDYLEAVKLPNWLDGLKHLEVVDMEGEKVEFPKDVTLKMKKLRYFSAYCVRGPKSINSWENIETLKYIRQEDWMECYSRQSFYCNVRKLGLFLDPLNRADEWIEVRASLERLKKLEYLQLRWNPLISVDPEHIVPELHTLTKLKLRGKLSKCPDASMLPPNLTHLKLEFSGLREESVLAAVSSRIRTVVISPK